MSRFPLTGRHMEIPCDRCHVQAETEGRMVVLYRPMDHRCSACHTTGRQKNR
jgi:hypothetical protein